jgi:hypothetical protein
MLVYKAGAATGDYHGQMNGTNFEKWVHEMLAPNLPGTSVIVFDNAPYHSVQVDTMPSKYAVKKDLIKWLQRKGISCDLSMRTEELFLLVKENQPKEKRFQTDQYLSALGHTVLRLPPCMGDLNAIELAWAKVRKLRKRC